MTHYNHKPWCAAVIAANAELAWYVPCDCKIVGAKPAKPSPIFECPGCGSDLAIEKCRCAVIPGVVGGVKES